MRFNVFWGLTAIMAASLAACGESTKSSDGPGALLDVSRVASLSRPQFTALLNESNPGQQLFMLAGQPVCGVDVHYFHYRTVGAKMESTTASGALMAPTGGAGCAGPRPVLVYTHGTAATKAYNLAHLTDPSNEAWEESAMMAAFFATHGYIVVASNYAGYDSSPLPYHPYLNADQQSRDVINALIAARSAMTAGLPSGVSDNGKLFVTGYSEGGHVTMATHRAMETLGMPVTASAPMSGPYAMLALSDAIFAYGNVGFSGTVYYPMVINSYQHAYGNVYQTLIDVYSRKYATGIDTLLPGNYTFTSIFTAGKLPETAVFDSTTPGTGREPGSGIQALDVTMRAPDPSANPVGALGFGNPYLVNNSFRVAYALDAWSNRDGVVPTTTNLLPPVRDPGFGFRLDLKKNDLRGWTPKAPVLMCGGMNDPDVAYPVNTLTMKALWATQVNNGRVVVVDVDPTSNGDPARAGQVAAVIGSIASGVLGVEPDANAAKISGDVQNAILSNDSFSSLFNASGAANSPRGAMVLGLAGVASQAVAADLSQGTNSPTQIATDVGTAVMQNYHFPLVQSACEVAASAWFAKL